MKSKILLLTSVIFLTLMINSFLADDRLPPNIPTEESEISLDEQRALEDRQQQNKTGSILLTFSLFISLVIGIVAMILMIKNPSKITSLIIQGLVFLGSII